jgi:hypothetical protein
MHQHKIHNSAFISTYATHWSSASFLRSTLCLVGLSPTDLMLHHFKHLARCWLLEVSSLVLFLVICCDNLCTGMKHFLRHSFTLWLTCNIYFVIVWVTFYYYFFTSAFEHNQFLFRQYMLWSGPYGFKSPTLECHEKCLSWQQMRNGS